MRLINTMTEAHDKQFIEAYARFVCRLPAKGYGTTEFNMGPERMKALIDAGRSAMQDYLRALTRISAFVNSAELAALAMGGVRVVCARGWPGTWADSAHATALAGQHVQWRVRRGPLRAWDTTRPVA